MKTLQNNVDYFPPGPISSDFMLSSAFIDGIMGPIGSGKSTTCVMKILRHARMQPLMNDGFRRSRYAVVRNTQPQLKTTTIPTWHQWVPKTTGKWVSQGPPTHRIIDPHSQLDIEVWFVALDQPADVAKVLSMELTAAWVNEAREIPKAIIDGLSGRVGRFKPNPRDQPDVWAYNPQIIMDTNPPEDDHWWYVMAEKDNSTEVGRQILESIDEAEIELRELGLLGPGDPLVEFFRQPGAYDEGAENLENLAPGYYAKARAGKSDDWINVYVDGNYGFVREGMPVYPDYKDLIHCKRFEPLAGVPIEMGLDFGFWPAAIFGQRKQNGQWRILSEVVSENMGTHKFADAIKHHVAERYQGFRITKITGDPSGDNRNSADSKERSTFQILQSLKINAVPALSNDPVKRHAAVNRPLTRMVDGEPGILIHPDCKVLRKGMAGGYAYRRVRVSGTERYQSEPNKDRYSHPCDGLQYLLLGGGEYQAIITHGEKQVQEVFYEDEFDQSVDGVI